MFFKKISLEERVIKSKNRNDELNTLISDFKPFIASVVQKKIGKYLEYGVDDELSVGLSAFMEAVNSFDVKKGTFLSFSRLVINARVIDFLRKKSKLRTISIDEDSQDENELSTVLDKKSMEKYMLENEEDSRKLEVIEYASLLKNWNIGFNELVRISPKKDTLRQEYKKAARAIIDNDNILNELMRTKRLPIGEIEKILKIHRKKLERGRIYIIAIVLAILNGLSYLDICKGDGDR
ncbi:MAG: RNA polymerase sigma-I factor [Actinobacteria bacterium]|nr:RNA polymerase sigma-I factor [Actinomycetota bacterium]